MSTLTASDASAALIDEFPEFRDELEELDGLLHVQFGCLSNYTEAAIDAGDLSTVRRHLEFIDRVFAQADEFVDNAVRVSYLEHIFFTGPYGAPAEALLSSRLREAWLDIHAHLEQLGREAQRLEQETSSGSLRTGKHRPA